MIALDTNVVIALAEGAPDVAARALQAIREVGEHHGTVVCSPVYAELCASPHGKPHQVREMLKAAHIDVDEALPLQVCEIAGRTYGEYARRRQRSGGGEARRILADFLIGAHAASLHALVTSDAAFYRRVFPDLRIVDVRGAK